MTHLNSRVSDLVDGRLDPAEAAQCMEHVDSCPQCRQAFADVVAARQALHGSADVPFDPALTDRLLAISPAPSAPLRPPVQPTVGNGMSWESVLSGGSWSPQRSHHGRRAGVGVVAVAALIGGLFALGDAPVVSPNTSRADTVNALSGTEPRPVVATGPDGLAWMREHGWSCPRTTPAGTRVESVGKTGSIVELTLTVPGGNVVIRERDGRLDPAVTTSAEPWRVDGRTVYVLSSEPWHVVWQSGSNVVDLVTDNDRAVIEKIVRAYPGTGYDPGFGSRIGRGWQLAVRTIVGTSSS